MSDLLGWEGEIITVITGVDFLIEVMVKLLKHTSQHGKCINFIIVGMSRFQRYPRGVSYYFWDLFMGH